MASCSRSSRFVLSFHVGTDVDRIQVADNGHSVEEEDTGDELFRVFHLRDSPRLDRFMESRVAPIVAHLSMHHVLVDGSQLIR